MGSVFCRPAYDPVDGSVDDSVDDPEPPAPERPITFEMLVQRPDGTIYDEETIGNDTYIVAEPGEEFIVTVVAHKMSDQPKGHMYRAGLLVDGVDVDYWKNIDTSSEESTVVVSFYGFLKGHHDIRTFTFAETLDDKEGVARRCFGTIRVEIYKAIPVEGPFENYIVKPPHGETQMLGVRVGKRVHHEISHGRQWANTSAMPYHLMVLLYAWPTQEQAEVSS